MGRDNQDSQDGTRIDLGDDLVEKTAVLEPERGGAATPIPVSGPPDPLGRLQSGKIDDQLQSAQILLREGLIEDAKKNVPACFDC